MTSDTHLDHLHPIAPAGKVLKCCQILKSTHLMLESKRIFVFKQQPGDKSLHQLTRRGARTRPGSSSCASYRSDRSQLCARTSVRVGACGLARPGHPSHAYVREHRRPGGTSLRAPPDRVHPIRARLDGGARHRTSERESKKKVQEEILFLFSFLFST